MAAECKIKNELGTISVVEDVITTVAGYAAIECIGIVAMASKRATDGLVELLGRENLKRGVRAVLSEDSVSINLYIIVEYGVSIAAVAKNVVETVKYRVENLVGVKVDSVNVTVEGIRVN
ncbi:MAG: Asp23/Gls24 family envelope stress response protein [Candidatus Spyradocola sp.]